MSRLFARWAGVVLGVALVGAFIATSPTAAADTTSNGVTYTVVPDVRGGTSPQGPGEWTVNYEKLAGGDPAVTDAINRILDDEADGLVWLFAASASKSSRWVFNTQGRLLFRPMTISELWQGQYNAFDLPNMPVDTVATRVFDSRSGIQIVWKNLFVDEQAGLNRLGELTKKILPATYPEPPLGGWGEYYAGWAPVERNFRFWIPTDAGIQMYFPEGQFGREVRSITIPWAGVADLIDPVFAPITS
ncbi:hypothetical protein [Mycobacterium sp. 852002-51961_SCH5331710]|uniref:hypothetical protein n=1 Tax=Mycobacterium sp. 852002-51961_SCH5331710 TaxID=1834105 RepID=UPI0007FED92A|nr:hypothetical protein [Mycobacterium sp. 852002-51961_SCH5331710]OBB38897.1 hypothetical protein A5752_11865 [Mycobacterium sp. 852002-51961_SCH5331710]